MAITDQVAEQPLFEPPDIESGRDLSAAAKGVGEFVCLVAQFDSLGPVMMFYGGLDLFNALADNRPTNIRESIMAHDFPGVVTNSAQYVPQVFQTAFGEHSMLRKFIKATPLGSVVSALMREENS